MTPTPCAPAIVWFETDYSVYTMRQASGRPWRIGQSQPVQVVFMTYRNSLRAEARRFAPRREEMDEREQGTLTVLGQAGVLSEGRAQSTGRVP